MAVMAHSFFRVLPSGLSDLLRQRIPLFAALPSRHQANISQMTWDFCSARYRHRRYPGAAFSVGYLSQLWGNLGTRNRVVRDFFSVIQGGILTHEFSAYQPFASIGECLMDFMNDPAPIDLMHDERRLAMPRNPILSRAAGDHVAHPKHSVWTGVVPSGVLPINAPALLEFAKTTTNMHHGLSAMRLLRLSRNTLSPGAIPLLYEQKTTGRLTEVLFAVQSTEREVLSAALDGYWDYDLVNAHFAIFSAWAKRLGRATPVVDEYVSHKRAIREQIAQHCGSSIEDVKQCLIALMYGAPLSANPDFAKIPQILGKEAGQRFVQHDFVRWLRRELSTVGQRIVNDLPRHRGQYGNAMNIFVPKPSKNTEFTLLCHALQGVEALILKTIVEHHGADILLCMHDGWVSRQKLDAGTMEDLIEQATGFRLALEVTQLPKYSPDLTKEQAWTFETPIPADTKGFWVSRSPQWAVGDRGAGVVTRRDLVAKRAQSGE